MNLPVPSKNLYQILAFASSNSKIAQNDSANALLLSCRPPTRRPRGALKIFNQEKIRWLTFQAGAAILGHALASYYLPFLEIGRLAGSLRERCGAGNSSPHDSQGPGTRQPLRLLPGGGRRGGGNGAHDEAREGRRGSNNRGAPARRGRWNAGARTPNDGDDSDGNHASGDSDTTKTEEGEPYLGTGGGAGRGSDRAWVRENTNADGLEDLKRQVCSACLSTASISRRIEAMLACWVLAPVFRNMSGEKPERATIGFSV